MNDTAAIVVTYNRCNMLKQNIECLLSQKEAECDIYVIDNASTDPTRQTVQSFGDSRVHYFNTGANLGGAGGFEWGVRQAVRDGYKYVWLMDDDTFPHDTALCEFFRADAELKGCWGALNSAAYWVDGSVDNMARAKTGLFSRVSDEAVKSGGLVKLAGCSFVSLLVKSEVVRDVGLPIGEYFIWTDDLEYTGRIARKYSIYLVSRSRVTHARKENMRVNFAHESPDRIDRYRYIYRNDVHCYKQYGVKGWVYLAVKFMYTVMNILLRSKGSRLAKIRIVLEGFREGFRFRPEVKRV
ncbi:MAG: glycosyltransferase family 2 protein [Synergistaceae bacterium]|nr:glycosyltransferase family 2 protein [Synergistaceae bacterium]